MESDHNIPPSRTIDDFLDEIYKEYKRRLPSPSISHLIFKPWHYRHYLPLPLLALCISNSSDATEILMLSYLLANTTFKQQMFEESNIDGTSSTEGSEYLAASIFLGMLIGGTCLGFLSDHIGRRPSLLIGLLTNAIAGFFSSLPFLTPTIAQLTFWRFIAGIGIGAGVPSLFALASEWSPKKVRGSVVTLVASFWMIGSLFVSAIAWILFSGDSDVEQDIQQYHNAISMWRIFAALCALPSGLGAWLVYLYVPESSRFLASSKQKYYQSAHVCNQLAISLDIKLGSTVDKAVGDQVRIKDEMLGGESVGMCYDSNYTVCIQPLTEEELRQDYRDSSISTGAASVTSLTVRLQQTIHVLLDSLKRLYSPKLRSDTTIPLQLLWFCLSFSTYGITTWINTLFVSVHLQNIYFNSFLFALANLPGNIISILYSDRWGRKKMLVGSLLGAASGLLSFAFLIYHSNNNDGDHQSNKGIVLCACLFQIFSIISWNSIDILSSECFPTTVRSAGMGICTACGRFGGIFAQFVNARLMMVRDNEGTSSSASVLIVACVTLLVSTGMPMFLRTDMTLVELKDEIIDSEESTTAKRSITLGCIGNSQTQKDHLSDTEEDYQSLRQETFLL